MSAIAEWLDALATLPWAEWALAAQWVFVGYFFAINSLYLLLNYISIFSIIRYMRDNRTEFLPGSLAEYQPPVSIIIPAYNEARSIVSSVRSLLQLNYPEFEILIVNDGSTDATMDEVFREFAMVEFPEAYRQRIATERIHKIYASSTHPNVRLIDKVNGGKADALNAGINGARYPLLCAIDADCILQKDSLWRVVRPFLEDSSTVAVGGVVRVLNGCSVKSGFLNKVGLPRNLLAQFQIVEYMRAFLFGRLGWSPMNALLVISGAFGMFYKERVIAVGGYRSDTIGEDMDLVVRLHRNLRQEKRRYRITFVPDPICWTEAPSDLASLRNQRMRWQRGLAESLVPNFRLMFSRRGGAVGWLAFPSIVLFELLGPIVEVVGYTMLVPLWLLGLLPPEPLLVFLFASVGMGMLLSINALFLEELSFHMYPRIGQQARLFLVAVLENLGYRQLNSLWRFVGLIKWMFSRAGHRHWGVIARDGSWQHN
jgi:cellulose synthase/poly-beta-1,6-N-acetylglucosamine synthase-like glycosyltransferase